MVPYNSHTTLIYFYVPGTSVPSERFSKAGELVAAKRDMVLFKQDLRVTCMYTPSIAVLSLCTDLLNYFFFFWGEGVPLPVLP